MNTAAIKARYIHLPNGRKVCLGVYAAAWKRLLNASPDSMIEGWGHFEQPAGEILREMRRGMHGRINRLIPGFGVGRKWSDDRFFEVLRAARTVNGTRVILDTVPPELEARLAHRLRRNIEYYS